jgi:hypothetical protein
MMDVNHTPPERMTAQQRRLEIAALLACGIARLRQPRISQSNKGTTESRFELAIPSQRSVHGDSNHSEESR